MSTAADAAIASGCALTAGPLPAPGTLPEPYPFESIAPAREGFVERDGVRSWYAQFGDDRAVARVRAGLPDRQRAPAARRRSLAGAALPRRRRRPARQRPLGPADLAGALHLRPLLRRLRRRARPARGRPRRGRRHLGGDDDGAARCRRAARARLAPGHRRRLRRAADRQRGRARGTCEKTSARMRADWPAYLDEFFGIVFSEPHSTKPYEDGVLQRHASRRPDRRDGPGGLVRHRPARARAGRCAARRS